jgi:hypothetical protein
MQGVEQGRLHCIMMTHEFNFLNTDDILTSPPPPYGGSQVVFQGARDRNYASKFTFEPFES